MAAAAPPPPPVHRVVFGRSVEGRPLSFVRVGDRDAPVHVLVVGCIHGNEPAGERALRVLERRRPPRGRHSGSSPRSTPTGWRPAAGATPTRSTSTATTRGAGRRRDRPARLLRRAAAAVRAGDPGARAARPPRPPAGLDLVPPAPPARLPPARRPAQAHPGLRAPGRPAAAPLPAFTGTAIGWENRLIRGSTAWVVELPAGPLSRAGARRHARATLGVARALRR